MWRLFIKVPAPSFFFYHNKMLWKKEVSWWSLQSGYSCFIKKTSDIQGQCIVRNVQPSVLYPLTLSICSIQFSLWMLFWMTNSFKLCLHLSTPQWSVNTSHQNFLDFILFYSTNCSFVDGNWNMTLFSCAK